jgi:hypothetical protein
MILFRLLPGYQRVPAREWMTDLYGKPDSYIVRSADGLHQWTAGELRELARKGQAIDVPNVQTIRGDIWEI